MSRLPLLFLLLLISDAVDCKRDLYQRAEQIVEEALREWKESRSNGGNKEFLEAERKSGLGLDKVREKEDRASVRTGFEYQ